MRGNRGEEQRQAEQRLGKPGPAQRPPVGASAGDLVIREPGAGVRREAPVEVRLPRRVSRQITAERRFDEMNSSVM